MPGSDYIIFFSVTVVSVSDKAIAVTWLRDMTDYTLASVQS